MPNTYNSAGCTSSSCRWRFTAWANRRPQRALRSPTRASLDEHPQAAGRRPCSATPARSGLHDAAPSIVSIHSTGSSGCWERPTTASRAIETRAWRPKATPSARPPDGCWRALTLRDLYDHPLVDDRGQVDTRDARQLRRRSRPLFRDRGDDPRPIQESFCWPPTRPRSSASARAHRRHGRGRRQDCATCTSWCCIARKMTRTDAGAHPARHAGHALVAAAAQSSHRRSARHHAAVLLGPVAGRGRRPHRPQPGGRHGRQRLGHPAPPRQRCAAAPVRRRKSACWRTSRPNWPAWSAAIRSRSCFKAWPAPSRPTFDEFDITVDLLDHGYRTMARRGPLAEVAEQFMYFETGQGSEVHLR